MQSGFKIEKTCASLALRPARDLAANLAGLVEANLALADHKFAQPLPRAQKARFDRG
jgi:hypothetical protein